MVTHHSATVRGGQVVVRGLDVPDGTRVTITIERAVSARRNQARQELVVPPDIAESLDQAFHDIDRGNTITWAESNAEIAQLRAEWIRRERLRVHDQPDARSSAGSKRRRALVAGESRPSRPESPAARAGGRRGAAISSSPTPSGRGAARS